MYLLFDIGGTKSRLALSRDGKTFEEPVIFDTPAEYFAGMDKIKQEAEILTKGEKILASAGGITGTLMRDRSVLFRSPNLNGWTSKDIKKDLSAIFHDAPVFLENDAAIVGLGEAVVGAGKGFPIVAYFTISTGVGGARIVNGRIDEHLYGFEPGQITIDSDGRTLEDSVSGTAVFHRFGKKPKDIPQESPLWGELAKELAIGLHDSLVQWSPDAIVLGGSMIVGDPYISVHAVENYLKEKPRIYPELPQIKKAELDSIGGIHGALAFLQQNIKNI